MKLTDLHAELIEMDHQVDDLAPGLLAEYDDCKSKHHIARRAVQERSRALREGKILQAYIHHAIWRLAQ